MCREAAMVELWVTAVEPYLTLPMPEQWGCFCEMSAASQRLAINVLAGLQVRRHGLRLAAENNVMNDDEGMMGKIFKQRVRELLQPIHVKMIEAEGTWEPEGRMRARLRVALDYARFQGLAPDEKKSVASAAGEKTEAVYLSQVDGFTTAEKKRHNKAV